METGMSTSKWITFFIKAGIPNPAASNYAIMFTDHRIQLNMLLDLSKEYLYDMGIKVMGDVIAILRHAKSTHEQIIKAKMIGNASKISSLTPDSKKTPATRILDHYTRKSSPTFTKTLSIGAKVATVSNVSAKKTLVSLKRKQESEYPIMQPKLQTSDNIKKVRRVLAEEEGAYNIKMPQGTTEKTRRILEKQKQLKRSVFDRLGDSVVSSSTDTVKNSSVFERLGPAKNQPTSTSFIDNDSEDIEVTRLCEPPLEYIGVLKASGLKRTTSNVPKISKVTTTATKPISYPKLTIKKRLGVKSSSLSNRLAAQASTTILKRSLADVTSSNEKSMPLSAGILSKRNREFSNASIKARLGRKTASSGGFTRKTTGTMLVRRTAGNIVARAKATASNRNLGKKTFGNKTVFERLGQQSF